MVHSFQLLVPPTPSSTSLAKGDLLLAEVQGPVAPAILMSCKVQQLLTTTMALSSYPKPFWKDKLVTNSVKVAMHLQVCLPRLNLY